MPRFDLHLEKEGQNRREKKQSEHESRADDRPVESGECRKWVKLGKTHLPIR